MKKIYVISSDALFDWCLNKNIDIYVDDLTDEQFLEINRKYMNGWHFNSIEDFIIAFNSDWNVPDSGEHYLRLIGE